MIKFLTILSIVALSNCLTTQNEFLQQQQPNTPNKLFVGYFETWSEQWKQNPADTTLARTPAYVNVVNLAFMLPDSKYSGNLDLYSAGIDFPYDGNTAKQAIAVLKQNNPDTKVLISVGGATYTNWNAFNENAVALLVRDLGLDGVDIDFEPSYSGCIQHDGDVSCSTDQQYIDIIRRTRNALPRPYIVSIAGWSIGAYGQGDYQDAQPQGGNTGLNVNMLRQAGDALDWIHIMSYDASNALDPVQAFNAYRSLFSGAITIGIEVPPEAWGGHVYTIDQVNSLADYVNNNGGAGLMLWSLQQKPNGAVTDDNPNAQLIAQAACNKFGLPNCNQPLPL